MKPDTSNWRNRTSYDYFDALTTEGLAWECLRRSIEYQHLYDKLIAENLETTPLSHEAERHWGLRFRRLTEPIVSATGRVLVNQRQFRPSLQLHSRPPSSLYRHLRHSPTLAINALARKVSTRYIASAALSFSSFPAVRLSLRSPCSYRLAMTHSGHIEAATRFWQSLRGRPSVKDTRITKQQRRRLRLMLRQPTAASTAPAIAKSPKRYSEIRASPPIRGRLRRCATPLSDWSKAPPL